MGQHSQGAVPECPALLLSGYYRHIVFRAGEGNDSASAKTVMKGVWFEIEREDIITVVVTSFIPRVGSTKGTWCL